MCPKYLCHGFEVWSIQAPVNIHTRILLYLMKSSLGILEIQIYKQFFNVIFFIMKIKYGCYPMAIMKMYFYDESEAKIYTA